MAWDLPIAVLMLVLGIVYGYTRPGKEDRVAILKKALLIGLVIGVVIGFIIALVLRVSLIGATIGATIGAVIIIVVFAVFFIIGTMIGDWMEARKKAEAPKAG
jgi:general stress protein CsbA